MQTYTVTRWEPQPTETVTVEAVSHREALEQSGLAEPGHTVTVDGQADRLLVRYKVNKHGRVTVHATYCASL